MSWLFGSISNLLTKPNNMFICEISHFRYTLTLMRALFHHSSTIESTIILHPMNMLLKSVISYTKRRQWCQLSYVDEKWIRKVHSWVGARPLFDEPTNNTYTKGHPNTNGVGDQPNYYGCGVDEDVAIGREMMIPLMIEGSRLCCQ